MDVAWTAWHQASHRAPCASFCTDYMRPLCTQGIGAELAKSLAGYIEASPALTSMNLLGNDFDAESATMLVRIAKVSVG